MVTSWFNKSVDHGTAPDPLSRLIAEDLRYLFPQMTRRQRLNYVQMLRKHCPNRYAALACERDQLLLRSA